MKGASPVIHVAHSIGSFFGLSGLATDVQGKQIAFIGDRIQGRQPTPFILPPQNAWTWTRVKYLADMARCTEHYSDESNRSKLWTTGAGDDDLVELQLPRLLALPTVVAEFVVKNGGTCLPHTVITFINTHIEAGTVQVPVEKWNLILQWCLAASQTGTDGSSLLKLGAPEPALCQDEEFLEWCSNRLATTLGREQVAHQPSRAGPHDNLHLVQHITENMGRSFVAGVQALAPTIVGATRQGGVGERDFGGEGMGGRMYSENNVAALKGYCGVVDPSKIPTIWDSFQQTKEIASHRHNLRVSMTKWARQTGKEIDKAPFFTEQTIRDMVTLNFNPGEAVPTYASAQRGLSILTCRPKSAQEVEIIKDNEEARRITAHTAQFNEVRRRQKTPPSPPPDTYFELRLSVNTFCALVWTLFGEECDYYKGLWEVAETLDLQEVHIIRDSFTTDVCRRITWAILSDGRSFFNTVLVEAQFRNGETFRWPTSLIYKITDDVRYANTITRPFYPVEWLVQSPPPAKGIGLGGNSDGAHLGTGTTGKGGHRDNGTTPKGRENAGGGGQRRQQWTDERHPKIVAMMADYISTRGTRVQLTEILDAANKRITDLPTLPEYMENGKPYICWAHILGRCSYPNCAFRKGHVPRKKISDSFADDVVAILTSGVRKCSRPRDQLESPGKRPKQE
jgi:hypothetical protein